MLCECVTNTISLQHLSRALGCGREYRKHLRDFLPFKTVPSPLQPHILSTSLKLLMWGVWLQTLVNSLRHPVCVRVCVRRQRKPCVNFTDYSRSDVCCYSSSVDNAMLCNDKGGTIILSLTCFFRSSSPNTNYLKMLPWNTFMSPTNQIETTLLKVLYILLDAYTFIYDYEENCKLKFFLTESPQNRHWMGNCPPPVWAKMTGFSQAIELFLCLKVYSIQRLDKENRKISNKMQICKVTKNSLQIAKNK